MGTSDKRFGGKLPKWVQRDEAPGKKLDTATYIGVIKNNFDPARAGRLQVWIPDLGGNEDDPKNWRTLSYASPFFGYTYQPTRPQNNKFDQVEHSYGFWAVPPDIDNQVLCTFVNGDPDRGFWFACIAKNLGHYMVPGIASGIKTDNANAAATSQKRITSDSSVPVVEFNENVDENLSANFYNNARPPHEVQYARLVKEGLDKDSVRGAISSSSQRESPSGVLGISTPGRPLKDPATDSGFQQRLQEGTLTERDVIYSARQGGHQFVMDDGDLRGIDNLVRIRTSSGHQILMNDTERVIYIANGDGSSWVELTGSGHVFVYAADSISIRSEKDINMHADGDINMNSKGRFLVRSIGPAHIETETLDVTSNGKMTLYGGSVGIGSAGGIDIKASAGLNMQGGGDLVCVGSNILLNSGGGAEVTKPEQIKAFDNNDQSQDQETKIWSSKEKALNSISAITPGHEPWPRKSGTRKGSEPKNLMTDAAPEKTLDPSECAPKAFAGGAGGKVTPPNNISAQQKSGIEALNRAMDRAGFNGAYGRASVLGIAGGECSWIPQEESYKYSKERLMEVYSVFRNNPSLADQYCNGKTSREEFFGFIYGPTTPNGKAVGNTSPEDGAKFYGRGFFQLTGRPNYTRYGKLSGVDIVNNPSLLNSDLDKSADVAVAYMKDRCKLDPSDPGYFEKACAAVGYNVPNIKAKKESFYNFFLKELTGADPQKTPNNNSVVTSSDGTPVTDGSGNPVQSGGSSDLDPGIASAKGKTVTDTMPKEWMSRGDAPTPSGGIDKQGDVLGLTQTHVKAMLAELGYFESRWDYKKLDTNRGDYVGRYQVNAEYLADAGYIKPGAITQYGNQAVNNPVSWTGKDGVNSIDTFFSNGNVQEQLQIAEFNKYYSALIANQGIKKDDDLCTIAGMIFVAHQFFSADQARKWRMSGSLKDNQGRDGDIYFNHGRYAIDVLAIQTDGGTAPTPGSGNAPSSSGKNPSDVLTGNLGAFGNMKQELQDILLAVGAEYLKATGNKMQVNSLYRSEAEQRALYDKWVAAGGRMPDNPKAAGIYRPAKGNGPHGGWAFDAPVAVIEWIVNNGYASKYGLKSVSSDPVHLQLQSFRPGIDNQG